MSDLQETAAVIVTEFGDRFEGRSYGATGQVVGIAHAVAQATGYQEVLTDPVRAGDIVIFASPHIGVVGVNDVDAGSDRVQAAGIVVRDPARMYSNFRAQRSLDEDLARAGTVGVSGVDTRALIRRVQSAEQPVRIGIFSGEAARLDAHEQLATVQRDEGTK